MSWLARYWAWTGGNIGAMPAQAVLSGAALALLRGPARRILRRFLGLEAAQLEAAAARRIAADLYKLHHGKPHPEAPARPDDAAPGRAGPT